MQIRIMLYSGTTLTLVVHHIKIHAARESKRNPIITGKPPTSSVHASKTKNVNITKNGGVRQAQCLFQLSSSQQGIVNRRNFSSGSIIMYIILLIQLIQLHSSLSLSNASFIFTIDHCKLVDSRCGSTCSLGGSMTGPFSIYVPLLSVKKSSIISIFPSSFTYAVSLSCISTSLLSGSF